MLESRRRLLLMFPAGLTAVTGLLTTSASSRLLANTSSLLQSQDPADPAAQAPTPRTRTPRSPSDPSDQPGNPNLPNPTKTMLEERQKNIKKQVEKLYTLASDLKAEVEKTDATTTLSLAMLKKTEEIERLAKQIRENAKG